jgi:hypothetical protein
VRQCSLVGTERQEITPQNTGSVVFRFFLTFVVRIFKVMSDDSCSDNLYLQKLRVICVIYIYICMNMTTFKAHLGLQVLQNLCFLAHSCTSSSIDNSFVTIPALVALIC